jgi:hypothetical protein
LSWFFLSSPFCFDEKEFFDIKNNPLVTKGFKGGKERRNNNNKKYVLMFLLPTQSMFGVISEDSLEFSSCFMNGKKD